MLVDKFVMVQHIMAEAGIVRVVCTRRRIVLAVSMFLCGVGAKNFGCGASCVRVSYAVRGPEPVLEESGGIVCAVVGAAGAAAVRWRAGGEAVTRVPVGPRAGKWFVSASVKRRARAQVRVSGIFTSTSFFPRGPTACHSPVFNIEHTHSSNP